MGLAECFVASTQGIFDKFGHANAVADWIERLTEKEYPTPHPIGAEMRGELERARQLVNEAELICQKVLGAL